MTPKSGSSVIVREEFIVTARRVPVVWGPASKMDRELRGQYAAAIARLEALVPKIVIEPYVGPIMHVELSFDRDVLCIMPVMKAPDARAPGRFTPWIDIKGAVARTSLSTVDDAMSIGTEKTLLAEMIVMAMREALQHELEEAITVDGQRVLDPHPVIDPEGET